MKARVRAEAVGFAAFLIIGAVALIFSKFPADKTIWWIVLGAFVIAFIVEICLVTPYQLYRRQDSKHQEQLNVIAEERDSLTKKVEELQQQPLTGIRLRNECDKWIQHAEAIIKRLNTEGVVAIPEAKEWLDEFPKFTAANLPIADHDKCNYGNEASETFHREKTKQDPSWEPQMYANFVVRRAAMLMDFRNKLR